MPVILLQNRVVLLHDSALTAKTVRREEGARRYVFGDCRAFVLRTAVKKMVKL